MLARLLLSHSADVVAQDIRGHSALVYAVDCGAVAMVKLLLRNVADVNQVDIDDRTPLDIAIFRLDVDIKSGDCKRRAQHQTVVELLTAAVEIISCHTSWNVN